MVELNNRDYYLRRALAAQAMAAKASDPGIASIHATMAQYYRTTAEQYDDLVGTLVGQRPAVRAYQRSAGL